MRHFALCLLALLVGTGCYSMRTERVLVVEADSHEPVAGVRVRKVPVRLFGVPVLLPPASEGVSDVRGMLDAPRPRGPSGLQGQHWFGRVRGRAGA